VSGVFNAVLVRGDVVGDTLYYGQGAGADATASAVVADIVDVARNLAAQSPLRIPAFVRHEHYGAVRSPDELPASYYLRVALLDKPGTLARVASILGEQNVSIAAMLQKTSPRQGNHVPVVLVVEASREKDLKTSLARLNELDVVAGAIIHYRIERFDA
jgi:homoserine dehydrogenase